ncbi:phosphopantothenoylcysteine decarboxylase [Actinomyces lilanjuaniae]|uniref:Coenzyme A biosynthesis bifunctional protein CoaBC n=1 Tax=Actinomyces lilanjuaniae TaxID=2321394 RepID=A0ABN5PMX6_9ACTO|nr:phosphopantothenoylcysteine decarboxylase [Actinomyces lilanjuaniae]AYD89768.1 phosphopantothenoylcysteine decarboxylase [Actinomyces lilanjuaniae]
MTGVKARRVVVGVAGSVAAYKAPSVIRGLRQAGYEVRTVATQAALRFIGKSALAAVSGAPVSSGLFDDPAAVEHVGVAEWAELVLVAPASADLIARVRAGRADDLLTATILATTAPVVLAPAMHTQMWRNPATVDNVAVLRRRGVRVIEPDSGPLTSGDWGPGRLPEAERVIREAVAALDRSAPGGTVSNSQDPVAASSQTTPADPAAGAQSVAVSAAPSAAPSPALQGRHVLVTAGGTREPLDPVRFLGNRSSGRQGTALAAAVAARGAQVTLVHAHVEQAVLDTLPGTVRVLEAGTAVDMERVVRQEARDADVVVMAAAVADMRPASVSATKLKKSLPQPEDGKPAGLTTVELVENPDILAGLVSDPPRPGQLLVGFAAETGDSHQDALAHGTAKARRKGAHLLAVNVVGESLGFGDVPNAVVVLDHQGHEVTRARGTKAQVAEALVDLVVQCLPAGGR